WSRWPRTNASSFCPSSPASLTRVHRRGVRADRLTSTEHAPYTHHLVRIRSISSMKKGKRMYPDRFPRNAWYVAARSVEVTSKLMSRWILGDPIVFYRRPDGVAAALVDRCVHRQMPLSLGRLKGDSIECGYHGLTYAPDGTCTRIPGADRVPER